MKITDSWETPTRVQIDQDLDIINTVPPNG